MAHPNHVRGERVGTSRLTEREVREIRRLASRGKSIRQLALEYERGFGTIQAVVARTAWRHVS